MEETLPKKRKEANPKNKKFNFYIKEIFALLFTLVGVLTSELLLGHLKNEKMKITDISLDWFSVLIASLVTLLSYGMTHAKLTYIEDAPNENLIAKLTNAFSQGIMYKTVLFSITN